MLSAPRQINFTKRGITQKPLPELKKLRKKAVNYDIKSGDVVFFETAAFEMYLLPTEKFSLQVRDVTIISEQKELVIKNGNLRKTMPYYGKSIRILSDVSSLEIFTSGKCFSLVLRNENPANKIVLKQGNALVKIWNMKNIFQNN